MCSGNSTETNCEQYKEIETLVAVDNRRIVKKLDIQCCVCTMCGITNEIEYWKKGKFIKKRQIEQSICMQQNMYTIIHKKRQWNTNINVLLCIISRRLDEGRQIGKKSEKEEKKERWRLIEKSNITK